MRARTCTGTTWRQSDLTPIARVKCSSNKLLGQAGSSSAGAGVPVGIPSQPLILQLCCRQPVPAASSSAHKFITLPHLTGSHMTKGQLTGQLNDAVNCAHQCGGILKNAQCPTHSCSPTLEGGRNLLGATSSVRTKNIR